MAAPAVVPGTPFHLKSHDDEALEKRRTRSRPADPSHLAKLNRGSFYAFGLAPPCAKPSGSDKTGAAAAAGAAAPLVNKQALPNASLVGLADLRKAHAKVKGQPQPAHTAFRFFLIEYCKSVSQSADNQQKLRRAVKEEAKQKWSQMSESEAARFLELAKADKERYGAEQEHFKQVHPEAVHAAKPKTKRGRGAAGRAGRQKEGVEGDKTLAVNNTWQKKSVRPESAVKVVPVKGTSRKKKTDGEQLLQDGEEEARSGSDSDEEGGVGYRSECSSDGDYLSASSEDERALPAQRPGTRHSERTASQQTKVQAVTVGKAAEKKSAVGKKKLAPQPKDRPKVNGQQQQQERDGPEEGCKQEDAAAGKEKKEQRKQKKRAGEEAEEAAGQGKGKQKRQRKEEAAAQAPGVEGKVKRRVEAQGVEKRAAAEESPDAGASLKRKGKEMSKAAAATNAGKTDPKPRSLTKVAKKAAEEGHGGEAAEDADGEHEPAHTAGARKSGNAPRQGGARALRSRG